LKNSNSTLKIILAFTAVYIIWGSTYLAIKFAIDTIPSFLMASMRFLTAGSILFIYAQVKQKTKIELIHWKSSFIVGGLLLLGGNGGVVWAEKVVPSGLTAILVSTVPIWIVIISFIIRSNQKPSIPQVAGITLGFIGLFFLVSPDSILRGESINITGAIVLIVATLSWSIGSVYINYAVFPNSKLLTVSMQMLAGGFLLLLLSTFTGEVFTFNAYSVDMRSFLSLLYLILFGSVITFTAYIWLLKTVGPAKTSTYAYVNPVVAVFLGYFLANEPLDLKIILSSVVIISAVVLITINTGKKKAVNN
jgi:drug/metabolite transporter (DMT)-like permease